MKRALAVAVLSAVASIASAQMGGMKGMEMKDMDMKGMHKDAKKASGRSHHAAGKVKSVNAAKGTVTIDHGPVASLNWPAMTMTFKAKDKALLEKMKQGEKVDFEFIQQGKDYIVTAVK